MFFKDKKLEVRLVSDKIPPEENSDETLEEERTNVKVENLVLAKEVLYSAAQVVVVVLCTQFVLKIAEHVIVVKLAK